MAKQDQDTDTSADDALIDVSGNPRVYELGFHLDPELPTEEMKKAYHTIREFIGKMGTIVAEGEPQKIQLAYTISRQETAGRRDFDSAYFAWIAYETSAENHARVLEVAKAESRFIRFIDVLTTKEAARHAAEMRLMAAKVAPIAPEKDESTSDAELDAALDAALPAAPGPVAA